jgi:WD40 repeat protein
LKHPWRVVALAFFPGGEQLVTASTDRHVRVWNTMTGGAHAPVWESSAHRGAVWAVAVSPNGRLVATAGRDRCVRVHDAATGTPIGTSLRHRGVVWAVAFDPDSKHLWSGSEDGKVCRWVAPTTTLDVPDSDTVSWAEALTGLRLDGDRVRVLGASEWAERRDRLLAASVRIQ